MKQLKTILVTFVLLGFAGTAIAGEASLEDDNNAKLARFKAKQRLMDSQNGGDSAGGSGGGECGSLNVGNVQGGGRVGRPREVTVIVTGDVINANNKCGQR